MKTLMTIVAVICIFMTGLLIAHNRLIFKDKSYGFESYADTYSVSIRSNNILEINRNGNTIFTEHNFCELNREEVIRP